MNWFNRFKKFVACSLGFGEIDWGQAPADVRIKLDID